MESDIGQYYGLVTKHIDSLGGEVALMRGGECVPSWAVVWFVLLELSECENTEKLNETTGLSGTIQQMGFAFHFFPEVLGLRLRSK